MTIKERLSLMQLLPTLGSVSEMVDVYDLARELKLSDEEKALIQYEEASGNIRWDYTKDPDKQINLSSDLYNLVMKEIDKLDLQKLIPLSMIELIIKLKEYGKRFETSTTHS